MPKKYPDETVYMKVDGKFKAFGKIYDRDHIGYGNYFVYNTKFGRGLRWIGATPDPDFIGLESAVEESKDNLSKAITEIFERYIANPKEYYLNFYMTDEICQAIRKTFLDKKKQMLKLIKE
jgi:hypothetical protein